MTAPTPYPHLPGTARRALTFWAEVFGYSTETHTLTGFENSRP
ncbi:PhnB protein [Paraoerskovia marina]|uniref:PhnB protein n=1 Tax=Paraoerskovia marina TaxID=545619 RepID=A0A1H1U553_9CELL|nr:hypothetical protein [Paraoerskovia marina]SDS67632.1 PhnB protein [Paraoerskovia marina]